METLALAHALCIGIAAIAAYTDARTGHIPNWITLPPLVLGPLLHGLYDGLWGAGASVVAMLLAGLPTYVLFHTGAIGGGDVKLFAAIGALAGPVLGIEVQLFAFVAGATFAATRLAYEGKLLRMLASSFRLMVNPLLPAAKRREVPTELMAEVRLGPPIFVATAFVMASRYLELSGAAVETLAELS